MRNLRTVMTLGLLLSSSISRLAAKTPPHPPSIDPPSICDAIPNNLVVNCGFETGTFAGWTQSGNLGFTGVDVVPNSGNFAAVLGPVGSDGFLTQTIPTVVGQTYTFSFYYSSDGGTPNDFAAFFNGVQVFSVVNDPAHPYQLYTFTVVATQPSTAIQFSFRDDPGFLFLDDVAVVANPAFLVRYTSNLINGGDGVVNITNTGASATLVTNPGPLIAQNNINGSLCVNIYTFAADEQEVACCSCLITPNALWSASVKTALLNSTLTPSFPNEVVIKLISSVPTTGAGGVQTCNPGTVGTVTPDGGGALTGGLLAWGTSVHGVPTATGPTFSMAETPFSQATLSVAELTRDVQECQFIQILGSGQFGLCKGCTNAGLGASAQ